MSGRDVVVLVAVALVAAAAGTVVGAVIAARRSGAPRGEARPLFTAAFWALAFERVVKSAAQGALLTIGGGQLDVLTADLRTILGGAAGAAVLSLLTSIGSAPFGPGGSPSLVAAPPLTPPADTGTGRMPDGYDPPSGALVGPAAVTDDGRWRTGEGE